MSDIAELFSRDPNLHSQQDRDVIILKLRQARAQYNLGAKGAGNPKKTTKKKVENELDLAALGLIPDKPKAEIDLEALGLVEKKDA